VALATEGQQPADGHQPPPILERGLGLDLGLIAGGIVADHAVGPYLDAGREWVVSKFKQEPPQEPPQSDGD
jgi:hypothetical protein